MTPTEKFLSRLEAVKGRAGAFTARCPAHDDRGPSLSVREADDGRVLMHCFAGCDVHQIVTAVGMDLTELFPPKRNDNRIENRTGFPGNPMKPAFFPSDLLRIISFEALVVAIAALDLAKGKPMSETDRERLLVAYGRIDEAVRYSNV